MVLNSPLAHLEIQPGEQLEVKSEFLDAAEVMSWSLICFFPGSVTFQPSEGWLRRLAHDH